jgi:hypothetical protein
MTNRPNTMGDMTFEDTLAQLREKVQGWLGDMRWNRAVSLWHSGAEAPTVYIEFLSPVRVKRIEAVIRAARADRDQHEREETDCDDCPFTRIDAALAALDDPEVGER